MSHCTLLTNRLNLISWDSLIVPVRFKLRRAPIIGYSIAVASAIVSKIGRPIVQTVFPVGLTRPYLMNIVLIPTILWLHAVWPTWVSEVRCTLLSALGRRPLAHVRPDHFKFASTALAVTNERGISPSLAASTFLLKTTVTYKRFNQLSPTAMSGLAVKSGGTM